MNEYQFGSTIKWLNDKFEETGPRAWWSECTRQNLPLIKKENSVHKFRDLYTGENEKVIVVVGASPAIKENIEHLKALDDKYVIMVSNSAAKLLLDNGIRPHYVVSIDGDDVIAKRDLNFDSSGLTLITTNASSPKVVKQWKGKILWGACYAIDPELKPAVKKLLRRRVLVGGNTSTFATSLAFDVFGARMFIFVGNEYCYDDQYYAHRRSKWEKRDVTHFRTKDVLGRDRLTNFPLWQYKIWQEKMIDDVPICTFIDTSFGLLGTDCKRLHTMTLPDAMKYVEKSYATRELAKTDWRIREKLRYDAAYSGKWYQPTGGMKTWKGLLKVRDFSNIKTILDVGCGFGQGVAICRNKGMEAYGIDISDCLDPYWEMGNIVPFCRTASADAIPYPDNHFDLVASFDVLEHIPEEGIDAVLKEIYRVGKSDYTFSICITPAVWKMNDGSEPHVLIKPIDWWRDKLRETGFHIHQFTLSKSQSHLAAVLTKHDHPPLMKAKENHDRPEVSRLDVRPQHRKDLRQGKGRAAVAGGC